jgi:hypothetical protein
VLAELEENAAHQPEDSPLWREIRYLRKHSEAGRLRYSCFRFRGVPLGSGAIESTIRRVINLRLKGNRTYWSEDNVGAVLQLRAAVVSERWEEIVEHTRVAIARDRRTDWRWKPPECLAVLKTLTEEEDILSQQSTGKHSQRNAALGYIGITAGPRPHPGAKHPDRAGIEAILVELVRRLKDPAAYGGIERPRPLHRPKELDKPTLK